jgi:ABC-type multidrug transport system fused ATPase/permease subunit
MYQAMLFSKLLNSSPEDPAFAKLNFGIVSSFASTDMERLNEGLNNMHNVFISPFSFVAFSVILIIKIGWIGAVAVVLVALLGLGIRWYNSHIMEVTKMKASASDNRAQKICEAIEKIRFIKMQGLDDHLEQSISTLRNQECKLLSSIYLKRALYDSLIELYPSFLLAVVFVLQYISSSEL